MPRSARIDWDAVASLASRGVITARELDELGVPRRTVFDRATHGGPWTRLLPGVLLLTTGTPTDEQRLDAAVRYAGRRAVITGLAGAALHGLRRLPDHDEVHVLVPATRKRASKGFVEVERTQRLPKPVTRLGFPVAPMVRSVLDAARRFSVLDQVRALLSEPVQRGLLSAEELATELKNGSRRGTALCRTAIEEMQANVHSPAEGWAYRLVKDSDLPPMQWNVRLLDAVGQFLGSPDAWIDDVALAWQIDSRAYHLSPAEYDVTVRRHSAMTAAGIVVVHTVPSRIRTEPRRVLDELRGAYRLACQRPRPAVTAVRRA